jgi:predicted DCC family thiol-disulfide oxidoreductase YuxK
MQTEPYLIIYDGDCVFCHNYVRLLRLRETVGKVDLVNARSDDPRVKRYMREGYDLNEGMLFVHGSQVYHGADAVHVLAGLSTPSTGVNRVNRAIFSSRTLSTLLYPFLKAGRRLTLLARGKGLIASLDD